MIKRILCVFIIAIILFSTIYADGVRTMYGDSSMRDIEAILDAMGVDRGDPNRDKLKKELAERIPALKAMDALEKILNGNVDEGMESLGEVLWDVVSEVNPIAKAIDYIKKAVGATRSYIGLFTGNAVENAYRDYYNLRYNSIKGNESTLTKEQIIAWIQQGKAVGNAKYNDIFTERIADNTGVYWQYKDQYKEKLMDETIKNKNIRWYEKIYGMRSTRYNEAVKDSNYNDEMVYARMFQDFEYDAVIEGLNNILFIKAAALETRLNNSFFGIKANIYLESNKPFANGEVYIVPADSQGEIVLLKNTGGGGEFDYSIRLSELDSSYFQMGREYLLKVRSPEFGERELKKINLKTMLEKSSGGSGMNWREYNFGSIIINGTQKSEVRININGLMQVVSAEIDSIMGKTTELISRYADIPSKFTAIFRINDGSKTVMVAKQVDFNPSTEVSEVNIDLTPRADYSGGAQAMVNNNYLLRSYSISRAEHDSANAAISQSLTQSDYDYLNSDSVRQQFTETDNVLRTNGEACYSSLEDLLSQLRPIDENTALNTNNTYSVDLNFGWNISDIDQIIQTWRDNLDRSEQAYQNFLSTESTYINLRMQYECLLDSYNKAVLSGSLPYYAYDSMKGVENRLNSLDNAYKIIKERQQGLSGAREQIAMLEEYKEDRIRIANEVYNRAISLLDEVRSFDEGEYTAYLNQGWIEKEEKGEQALLSYIAYLNTYMQLRRFNNIDQVSDIISSFNEARKALFTFLKECGKIDNLPLTLSDHSAANIEQELELVLNHADDFFEIINKNAEMDEKAGRYYAKYSEAFGYFDEDSPVLHTMVDNGLLGWMDLNNRGYLSQESRKILANYFRKTVEYKYYPQVTLSKSLIAEAPDSMLPQDVYPVIFNKLKKVYEGQPWDADSTLTFGTKVYNGGGNVNNNNSNNSINNSSNDNNQYVYTGLNLYKFTQAKKLPQKNLSIKNFPDISKSWAKDYITELSQYGIISGTDKGQFLPKDNVTREQFIKMILAASGIDINGIIFDVQTFSDVPKSRWSYKSIEAAVYYNLISPSEYGNGFEPSKVLTREEMGMLLVRSLGSDDLLAQSASDVTRIGDYFSDDNTISPKYRGYAILAFNSGLMQGSDGKFNPFGNVTREQAATVIYRLIELNGKNAN